MTLHSLKCYSLSPSLITFGLGGDVNSVITEVVPTTKVCLAWKDGLASRRQSRIYFETNGLIQTSAK